MSRSHRLFVHTTPHATTLPAQGCAAEKSWLWGVPKWGTLGFRWGTQPLCMQPLLSSSPAALMLICFSLAEQSEFKGHLFLWPSLQHGCGCKPEFRDQWEEQLILTASSDHVCLSSTASSHLCTLLVPPHLQLCVSALCPGRFPLGRGQQDPLGWRQCGVSHPRGWDSPTWLCQGSGRCCTPCSHLISPSAKWDKTPLCVFGGGFPGCCSPQQLVLPLGLCGTSFEGMRNYKFMTAFGILKCTRSDGEKHWERGKEEKG